MAKMPGYRDDTGSQALKHLDGALNMPNLAVSKIECSVGISGRTESHTVAGYEGPTSLRLHGSTGLHCRNLAR